MGMDVYGLQPNNEPKPDEPNWTSNGDDESIKAYFTWQKNTPGAYFRASVWMWHPLWDYVEYHCKDIFNDDFELLKTNDVNTLEELSSSCHHNDGFTFPKQVAKKIAHKLFELDKLGSLEEMEVEDDIRIERMGDEKCDACNGTGTREGWEGWQSQEEWLKTHPSLEIQKQQQPVKLSSVLSDIFKPQSIGFNWANKMKGCNVCHGKGNRKPFESSFRFKAEYVREFAEFCDKSGGFQIW